MLKVWGRRSSSNVQAVMWCIGELGLEYERIDAGFKYGVNDTAEYLAMNPNGTVPTIRDGAAEPLWESAAIIRYLGGSYGDPEFWPTDSHQRANVDRWAEWSKINIAQNFTAPIFWMVVRMQPGDCDPAVLQSNLDRLHRYLSMANDRLAGQAYLVSDQFTLADIQFGHLLYRYYGLEIERQNLPHVEQYYRRLTDRPAYAEHVMVSWTELARSM